MILRFQEKPWDLFFSVGYVLVVGAVILALGVGNLLGLAVVIFFPGYILVAALFPEKGKATVQGKEGADVEAKEAGGIDWIERIALSFGLSIAVVPLIGLLLNFTPFGIRLPSIIVSLIIFSAGVGFVAYWRRMKLPVEMRLDATIEISKPAWKEYTLLDKVLTIALVASVIIAFSVLAYVVATPRPGERFTEFYILDKYGKAQNYPTKLNRTEQGTVIIGIVNHEFETVPYSLRVDLVGVQVVRNASTGGNETVEVNRTQLYTTSVQLENDMKWENLYNFTINEAALWKVQFLLFRGGDISTPYRELHLFVDVV